MSDPTIPDRKSFLFVDFSAGAFGGQSIADSGTCGTQGGVGGGLGLKFHPVSPLQLRVGVQGGYQKLVSCTVSETFEETTSEILTDTYQLQKDYFGDVENYKAVLLQSQKQLLTLRPKTRTSQSLVPTDRWTLYVDLSAGIGGSMRVGDGRTRMGLFGEGVVRLFPDPKNAGSLQPIYGFGGRFGLEVFRQNGWFLALSAEFIQRVTQSSPDPVESAPVVTLVSREGELPTSSPTFPVPERKDRTTRSYSQTSIFLRQTQETGIPQGHLDWRLMLQVGLTLGGSLKLFSNSGTSQSSSGSSSSSPPSDPQGGINTLGPDQPGKGGPQNPQNPQNPAGGTHTDSDPTGGSSGTASTSSGAGSGSSSQAAADRAQAAACAVYKSPRPSVSVPSSLEVGADGFASVPVTVSHSGQGGKVFQIQIREKGSDWIEKKSPLQLPPGTYEVRAVVLEKFINCAASQTTESSIATAEVRERGSRPLPPLEPHDSSICLPHQIQTTSCDETVSCEVVTDTEMQSLSDPHSPFYRTENQDPATLENLLNNRDQLASLAPKMFYLLRNALVRHLTASQTLRQNWSQKNSSEIARYLVGRSPEELERAIAVLGIENPVGEPKQQAKFKEIVEIFGRTKDPSQIATMLNDLQFKDRMSLNNKKLGKAISRLKKREPKEVTNFNLTRKGSEGVLADLFALAGDFGIDLETVDFASADGKENFCARLGGKKRPPHNAAEAWLHHEMKGTHTQSDRGGVSGIIRDIAEGHANSLGGDPTLPGSVARSARDLLSMARQDPLADLDAAVGSGLVDPRTGKKLKDAALKNASERGLKPKVSAPLPPSTPPAGKPASPKPAAAGPAAHDWKKNPEGPVPNMIPTPKKEVGDILWKIDPKNPNRQQWLSDDEAEKLLLQATQDVRHQVGSVNEAGGRGGTGFSPCAFHFHCDTVAVGLHARLRDYGHPREGIHTFDASRVAGVQRGSALPHTAIVLEGKDGRRYLLDPSFSQFFSNESATRGRRVPDPAIGNRMRNSMPEESAQLIRDGYLKLPEGRGGDDLIDKYIRALYPESNGQKKYGVDDAIRHPTSQPLEAKEIFRDFLPPPVKPNRPEPSRKTPPQPLSQDERKLINGRVDPDHPDPNHVSGRDPGLKPDDRVRDDTDPKRVRIPDTRGTKPEARRFTDKPDDN